MQANELFTINKYTNPRTGSISFRVTGTLDGKQIRKNRGTMEEAMTVKQDLEREALNMTPLPAVTTRLTNDQAAEAEGIFRRIAGKPYTLTQLFDFALLNYAPPEKAITITAAIDLFLTSKNNANRRDATVNNLSVRLNRLKAKYGSRNVGDIQPDHLLPLIFREGSAVRNQKNDCLVLTNFFNWALRQKYCSKNPMESIDEITVDIKEPEIMTVAEARKLMATAEAYGEGMLVPYFALALFCAIRPAEVARLKWDAIQTDTKTVTIGAKIAKCRGRRIVTIPDNALEYLLAHELKKTPIVPASWRKDFDAVRLAAGFSTSEQPGTGLKAWTPDILRHTGISYHLAEHEHEGKTAAWAGNSPDIIQRHYKGLVKKADAAAFWDIQPGDGVVIPLAASV